MDCFVLYRDAIDTRLAKLQKYYLQIDTKPVFILALGMFLCLFKVFSVYIFNYSFPPILQTQLYQTILGWS